MMVKKVNTKNKVLVVVLDGWGVRKFKYYNAIEKARTPNFDILWSENPHTTLHASQQFVGLPKGYIGNSEVGHLHIGAGRIIPQELERISNSILDKTFFKNKEIIKILAKSKKSGRLHIMGLLSDGGVHSHIDHLFALLEMAKKQCVKDVYVHCFLDGRDVPEKSGIKYLDKLKKYLKKTGVGKIASITGRYYAMDRDTRWDRIKKSYDAITKAKAFTYEDSRSAILAAYARGETDEFVKPTLIAKEGVDVNIKDGDSVIFFNFREDRARQITHTFTDKTFTKFKRGKKLNIDFLCFTKYDDTLKQPVAFNQLTPKNVLGEILSKNKIRQFRIAETEKYAHVTYFFNGGKLSPFKFEDRLMIPSPRISTYDKQPSMSALKIKDAAINRIKSGKYGFILLNFANADMVGHTGKLDCAVSAVQTVDTCLGSVVKTARENNYSVIIIADHGNAEEMSGKHKTTHTLNKVPCIIISDKKLRINRNKNLGIANVSPTVLGLIGIKIPKEYAQVILRD